MVSCRSQLSGEETVSGRFIFTSGSSDRTGLDWPIDEPHIRPRPAPAGAHGSEAILTQGTATGHAEGDDADGTAAGLLDWRPRRLPRHFWRGGPDQTGMPVGPVMEAARFAGEHEP